MVLSRLGYLLSILILLITTPLVHAQITDCALATRLKTGIQARISVDGLPNNLRSQPTTSAAIMGQLPPGSRFTIMDGPQCADGYVWWQVSYRGTPGWTAEGNPVTQVYWLERVVTHENPLVIVDEDFVEPEGCLEPPDDYTHLQIGYATLNARTLAMLDYAQALYQEQGGILDFRRAITQGSYTGGAVDTSFGTHDGGGAIDLSVRSLENWRIMNTEIIPILHALRTSGFAAWLREEHSLYPGSPIHIHAIAIGDLELSEAARAQIDGEFGYLRGYDGLPRDDGIPQPDRSGAMIVCRWMIEQGFNDLRTGLDG